MWLILVCSMWCDEESIPSLPRAAHWSASAAIYGIPTPREDWRQTWETPWDDALAEGRFETQRACLRALRRAMPAGREESDYPGGGWELESVTHHREYVESFGAVGRVEGAATMMRTYYFACFQEAPRIW